MESIALDDYLLEHMSPEHPYLHQLYRATHTRLLRPRMASGPLQGKLLTLLCRLLKPRTVVEIGTYSGYSALAMARRYNESCADELVFYDITASSDGRALFADVLSAVASEVFIPLTVGGGIRTLEDFDRVLKAGADKVSVNSGAIADPSLIGRAAKRYGDQCVVLSMDVKRVDETFRLFANGGRVDTGIDALAWARAGVEAGAGEVVLNSIDADGVRGGQGYEGRDGKQGQLHMRQGHRHRRGELCHCRYGDGERECGRYGTLRRGHAGCDERLSHDGVGAESRACQQRCLHEHNAQGCCVCVRHASARHAGRGYSTQVQNIKW